MGEEALEDGGEGNFAKFNFANKSGDSASGSSAAAAATTPEMVGAACADTGSCGGVNGNGAGAECDAEIASVSASTLTMSATASRSAPHPLLSLSN